MNLRRTRLLGLLTFTLALSASACDADTGEDATTSVPASSDPRCASLCIDEPPEIDGAYEVCSAESVMLCVDLCEQRIEDTDNLCAECLLEDARFRTPYGVDFDVCSDTGTCYVGINRYCDGGCRSDDDGTFCDVDDCEGAESEYQEQVRNGEACAYDRGDDEARAACHARQHPRQDVTCDVEFDSVTACADVCG